MLQKILKYATIVGFTLINEAYDVFCGHITVPFHVIMLADKKKILIYVYCSHEITSIPIQYSPILLEN